MNTLTITKEVKQVQFNYETENLIFVGNCEIAEDGTVNSVNAQINLSDSTAIGNCNSHNNSISVNIWNSDHKEVIDTAASEFKNLLSELNTSYSQTTV